MATKTVRTPTKVRANREAVIEYFNAMKQEPVKDGSTLQQTPSGLHFKIPTKRLVYESDHYAVFDVEESASSQSDDASFHSLRGQESIEAPQGFYYGTENESQRYHGGREHQQTASTSGLQDRRYTNSQRSTSDNRDSTFTTQQDSRHYRMSGASQTYHYRGGSHEKSTASVCTPDEKLRSGPAGMQQQASTVVEQSKVDGGQHRTTTSSHSQGGWQSAQHGSQHGTVNQKQGGVSGTADRGHLYGYVDDKRADRKGEEAKYEEDILRKGFEEMMKEAVSSTKEINQFLYDLWRTQRMCDITIKVNEKEFHAHKLALAAHSEKFTNRYCEEAPSTVTEVILPDATPEATEALINYIYTNELTLTAENIESIIVCARQLGIKSALNFCQDFLNSFNEDSVLFLLPIAQRQGFTEVAERMFGFINKSSLVMLQSVGFLQCEVHQVEWMISRDELVVSTELEVFMAVLRWINHDQSDRIKYAPMLIGCVRLIYISPEDLVKHVEPETHIFNIQKCFEMLYFAFRYHAIKLSGSTMYTIMKVPPPRRYTVPVSEQSQIADRRISEKPTGATNKTNNMSCPALHYSYASTGSEIRRDFPGGRNVAAENSKLLSESCSDNNRQTSGSPVKAGILRPTGQSSCVSAKESSASKQGSVREWSSGYCTEDAQQRANQTGSQALKYSPEGRSAGIAQSQNSPQIARGERNGSMGPKRLSFSETLATNTDDTRGYNQLGRGQESRDAEPSRDSEQDSDKASTESDSSGSAKMPKPRRVVNKIHQARPETEKPFERTKFPKTRTRNKPLSRDRFLVIGGIDPFEVTDYQTSRLVEEYFPGKSEWTAKTSLPDSRHHTCACLLDGFIYLVGGSTYSQEKPDNLANPTSTCFRYDPDKDNWSRISSLQTPRMYHGAGVLDGVVYAVGGHDYTGRALDTVEYYNADTDSWSYAANMTEPKLGVACIGYKGHLYVMGGSIDRGGKKVVLKTVECYDPKLNCWVRKRSLPKPLCHACVLEVNNYLFLLGGATQRELGGDMVSSNMVYRYSRLSEVWTEFTEMITPRHDAGAVAVGCNIYVVGGICTQSGEAVDTIEVLDCETATWEEENEEEFRPVIGVACVLMPRL